MQGALSGWRNKNNSEYVTEKKRCYIEAARDIPAYSRDTGSLWRRILAAIRYNIRLEESKKKKGKARKPSCPISF